MSKTLTELVPDIGRKALVFHYSGIKNPLVGYKIQSSGVGLYVFYDNVLPVEWYEKLQAKVWNHLKSKSIVSVSDIRINVINDFFVPMGPINIIDYHFSYIETL